VTPLTPELQPEPATGPIISPDGSFVLYYAPGQGGEPDLYSIPAAGGAARKICESCGRPKGISSDGSRALTQFWAGPRVLIFLVDLSTGERKEALVDPDHHLYNAFYSWDGQWATFLVEGNADRWRVYITPVENYMPAGPNRWTPLTSGEHLDNKPQLSPDANTLYFTSDRDGSKCIWAQRLNPITKHPVGEPFPIQHLHDSTSLISPEVSIARGMIVTSVNELRGDIWMMDLKP